LVAVLLLGYRQTIKAALGLLFIANAFAACFTDI
jgi:hypothetical protein